MLIIFDEENTNLEFEPVVENVIQEALKCQNQPKNIEVEFMFVDEDEIREINRENRDVDKVTDVLSFPMLNITAGQKITNKDFCDEINPETNNFMLGSIVICTKRAMEQALEYGHSVLREIAYLTTHGILHLLGYDHIEENDKKIMREKEEEILLKLNIKRDSNV